MKPTIAIDPGANGGIAWRNRDGEAHADKMPDGMTEQAEALRSLRCDLGECPVWLEKTGTHVMGNAAGASVTFARHCGNIEAILYMLGFPVWQVAPGVWMKSLGTLPKEKADRKRAIKEAMQRRFPALKVTLATADALALLVYGEGR